MAFDPREKEHNEVCAESYCRQVTEKFSLKIPLCICNLERLLQTTLLFFWSLSKCRVPLFNHSAADSIPRQKLELKDFVAH